MSKRKYVVVTFPYDNGGNIVLNTLVDCLDRLGEQVSIIYWRPNAKAEKRSKVIDMLYYIKMNLSYDVKTLIYNFFYEKVKNNSRFRVIALNKKIKKIHRKRTPFISRNTIVIYPEVYYGNPLKANNVVRWFLNYNKFQNDDNAYGENDFFFCYRKQFNDPQLNPQQRELYLPYFDLNLYRRTNWGERKGKCFVVRKGKFRSDLPTKFDGIVVDDLSEEEKVEVFNKSEYCISYDTQTAYSAIAAMCGCKSIVVMEEGKSREDYLTPEDIKRGIGDGIAYGFNDDELMYAEQTRDNILERYKRMNGSALKRTKKFVEECNAYFD